MIISCDSVPKNPGRSDRAVDYYPWWLTHSQNNFFEKVHTANYRARRVARKMSSKRCLAKSIHVEIQCGRRIQRQRLTDDQAPTTVTPNGRWILPPLPKPMAAGIACRIIVGIRRRRCTLRRSTGSHIRRIRGARKPGRPIRTSRDQCQPSATSFYRSRPDDRARAFLQYSPVSTEPYAATIYRVHILPRRAKQQPQIQQRLMR